VKIKRDPKAEAISEIAEVLRNHEWLFFRVDPPLDWIDYPMLADLVYDMIQQRRGEVIN
jgi:hypothetical protein